MKKKNVLNQRAYGILLHLSILTWDKDNLRGGGKNLRACLHGGGGPQVGEVTRLGGVTRLSI